MKKFNKQLTESISIKILSIVILISLLLIPGQMVKNLIKERSNTEAEVKKDIGSKWGDPQIFTASFLTILYKKEVLNSVNGEDQIGYSVRRLYVLPEELNISGDIEPVVRKRGIYKAQLYNANLKFSGKFAMPDFDKMDIDTSLVMWDKISFNIGIEDMSGIRDMVKLNWGGKELNPQPGIKGSLAKTGLSTFVSIEPDHSGISFDFEIGIRGSESIDFVPLGKITKVNINSTWDSPSFQGKFVPEKRKISPNGFEANWTVLDLNRNYPQQWLGEKYNVENSKFGVNFIKPVGEYQKNMRSVKYSLLIIVLIFSIYFFFEIIGRYKIHPIQYLFVGLALSIFFLLLLSVSEQWGFDIAYLVSAVATSLMILIYSAAILKNNKYLLVLSGFLVTIYGYVYIVLQLEDYALLAGSLGLFFALFSIMYYSRKINWYEINKKEEIAG